MIWKENIESSSWKTQEPQIVFNFSVRSFFVQLLRGICHIATFVGSDESKNSDQHAGCLNKISPGWIWVYASDSSKRLLPAFEQKSLTYTGKYYPQQVSQRLPCPPVKKTLDSGIVTRATRSPQWKAHKYFREPSAAWIRTAGLFRSTNISQLIFVKVA